MRTTIASIAAVACVAFVAAAAPRADISAYQYGLAGNDWWASQRHHVGHHVTVVAPAALHYGLMGNDWWAAHARKGIPAN